MAATSVACCHAVATAAPSTVPMDDTPPSLQTPAEGVAPLPGVEGLGELGDQSRTIKLLLELQAAPEAAPKEDRAKGQARAAAGKASAAKVIENPFADADGPFGAPAVAGKPASPASQAADWQAAFGTGIGAAPIAATGGGPAYEPYSSAGAGQGASRSDGGRTIRLIPPELLQWLRDHRYEIIGGSVVLLLLVSGGAALQSQRQR